MTLREQVARAIAASEGEDWHSWEEHYLDAATAAIRVVLEALKEPSEEMLEAPLKAKFIGTWGVSRRDDLRREWQAMLATAIRQLGGEWECVEDCNYGSARTDALAAELEKRQIDF